jgi:hypothetical protein
MKIAVLKDLAARINQVMTADTIPEEIRESFAIKLCRDYPTLFEWLLPPVQLRLLETMETELARFHKLAKHSTANGPQGRKDDR